MGYHDAMDRMERVCLETFGVPVTYQPVSGEAVTVSALLGDVYRDEFATQDMRLRRVCRILSDDLAEQGIAEPVHQVRGSAADQVIVAGFAGDETWTVADRSIAAGSWVIELVRDIRVRP